MPKYETQAHRRAEQEVRDFFVRHWSGWTHEDKVGQYCPYDGVFHESAVSSTTPDLGLRQVVYEVKVRDAPVAQRPITVRYAMRNGLLLSEHKWDAVRAEAARRGPTAIPVIIVRIEGRLFGAAMDPALIIGRRPGQPRKDRAEPDKTLLLDIGRFKEYAVH